MTHEIAHHVAQHLTPDVNPVASMIMGLIFGSPVLLVWCWWHRIEHARANQIRRQREVDEVFQKLNLALDRKQPPPLLVRKEPPAPVARNKGNWVTDKHWRN